MKDFSYAKNRNNKRKWYVVPVGKYEVFFWALPILPFVLAFDHFNDWNYKRMNWTPERATKILDHILPKVIEWVEEDNAYYYCMNWGRYNLWHCAPTFDRKWARKFQYDLQNFIRDGYEKEGFTKSIEKDWEDVWVKFAERA